MQEFSCHQSAYLTSTGSTGHVVVGNLDTSGYFDTCRRTSSDVDQPLSAEHVVAAIAVNTNVKKIFIINSLSFCLLYYSFSASAVISVYESKLYIICFRCASLSSFFIASIDSCSSTLSRSSSVRANFFALVNI